MRKNIGTADRTAGHQYPVENQRTTQAMKNILLATDLSAAAASAARYAAWLAEALDARLTLMSAYHAAPVFAGSSIPESPEAEDRLPGLIHRRLEEMAALLGTGNRLSIDILARPGNPVSAILSAAREIDADLIVVGKAGVGQPGDSAFGTTVVTLARKTTIPLLIVPCTTQCLPPKTIAIPGNLLDEEIPEFLRVILGRFRSRLYGFAVQTKAGGETVEVYGGDPVYYGKEPFHLLYEIPVGSNMQHSVENFIEVAPIHWLAVHPLHGPTPERWILSGRTKELALNIHVPLLILPGTKKATARNTKSSA